MTNIPTRAALLMSLLSLLPAVGIAQRFEEGRRGGPPVMLAANLPYDGSFEFARIRYGTSLGSFRRGSMWAHDYPRAEANFSRILQEVSTVRTRTNASAVIGLDDPALFQHAIAYIVEVGYWLPTQPEMDALATWLRRGGFLIVDDFQGNDIINFEQQIQRVLPEAVLMPIPPEHPIFDSFYRFTEFAEVRHPYSGVQTSFVGIFEDNDPSARLMAVINYNGDIAEYWEFSDQGFFPMDVSNVAYKLGVNYVVYALTR